MEALLVRQIVLHDNVSSAIENGRKTKLEKRTQVFFKQKLIDLRILWQEFTTHDRKLAKVILTSREECKHDYIKEQKFDKLEIKYSEYMGELEDGLKDIFPDGNTSVLHPEYRSAQLPKITLPKFNGEYNSWRSFYDLFTSLVHDNSQLQAEQKLHYLKRCLTGDAERVLRHTPITLVIAHGRNGHSITLRCLLDSGSQASFITEHACKQLRIHSTHAAVEILGLNKNQTAFSKGQVQLRLESTTSSKSVVQIKMLVLKNITDFLPSKETVSKEWEHLQNLELADPTFWDPGPIDKLLGANIYGQIVCEGIRRGPKGSPVAINTSFGWIVMGSTTLSHNDHASVFTIALKPIDELNRQIRQFWETEEVPEHDLQSFEEKQCQKKYEASHCRASNGQYQVRLPFIDERGPVLGESRNRALKRFEHLQRKFNGNPQLQQDYETCLDEYLELGHMVACDPPKADENHYYIPHHAVFKQSTTTKLRVVFDASARTTNGKSLNEQLLIGPTLQPKLFSIVLNWRKHQVAMTADIERMYWMIWVHPEDRTFQRILWRSPTTKALQDYQLNTVTFGTSAAPYLAIKTLQQLATDEKNIIH